MRVHGNVRKLTDLKGVAVLLGASWCVVWAVSISCRPSKPPGPSAVHAEKEPAAVPTAAPEAEEPLAEERPVAEPPKPPAGPAKYTYVDLAKKLTDLEGLAVLPSEGETCAQWSSYDRRSRYDEQTGRYVGWSANGDGTGVIRREGDSIVMAEMEGPGCIWRIWSARAQQGRVKIYLDGKDGPAVDLPFSGYFDRKHAPFTYPSLVHVTARGLNCYVPIPYQKSCRIVAEKGWGRYYEFVYTTYPEGTVVPTFTRELAPEETAALEEADRKLSNCGTDPAGPRPGEAVVGPREVTVAAGGTATLASLTGPRAITAISVTVDPEAYDDIATVLRRVLLRVRWDGDEDPSVWTPLGDFFGTAYGINKYRSLPLGMTDDGFYSLWYMPFAKSALVELVNEGDAACALEFGLTHAPLSRPIQGLGRFHAKWHRNAFLPEEPERKIDWTMLRTSGRGRYCGVMLHVWNPRGGWWGEGDEKFFVDGEKFPSTFGTGSEDYFGYAWCDPTLFENAYHNQTISMGNRGHVSVNRWHVTDNIPFQKSFEGCIEKYYPDKKPTLYACIAYWYLAPGGTDPYEPVSAQDRTGYYGELAIVKVKGAIEGEKLKVIEKARGDARLQGMAHYKGDWSEIAHLWWTGARPGDRLALAVPVRKAGRYEIKAQLTKARDYAIVRLYLDGKALGDEIDLYNPEVIPTGEISLGVHELTRGEHRLGVEIVGANAEAVKSYMFGLDYVKLVPVE